MARSRTERRGGPALGAAARKRAFLAATGAIATAAGVMLALGVPSHGPGSDAEPGSGRRVIDPDPTARPASPLEREPDAAELRDARVAAARFSRAFLARESGRFGAAVRRRLRASATPWTWKQLRRPLRATPAWWPPLSRFERVSGLGETSLPGVVEATVAFRRGGHLHYLSLLMSREGGRWRATPKGL